MLLVSTFYYILEANYRDRSFYLKKIIQIKQTLNIGIEINASSPFNTKVFMFIHEKICCFNCNPLNLLQKDWNTLAISM